MPPLLDAPDEKALREVLPPDAKTDPLCAGEVAGYRLSPDLIANSEIAKRMALLLFARQFPDLQRNGRSLDIQLKEGIWYISETIERGAVGGGMNAAICRANGRVIALYVTQ